MLMDDLSCKEGNNSKACHLWTKSSKIMVDNDPYILYNKEMKNYASNLFKEAAERGYTSTEDKARYLTGHIFDNSPYGFREGTMEKNSIEIFNSFISDNKEEHFLMCSNKTILQRALLASQGIETRNHVYEIIPFSYPYKPRRSGAIVKMNDLTGWLVKPFVKAKLAPSFPHLTADVKICEEEINGKECQWITMDASMDSTKRLLEIRPIPDKNYYFSEKIIPTIESWKEDYIKTKPLVKAGTEIAEIPIAKDFVRMAFNTKWLQSFSPDRR